MESINQQVWKALQTDPAIMRDLQRKLVNTRALAKYLIQKYDFKVSLDAIISSIRRFPLDDYQEEEKILQHIFKEAIVSTKNNIACVTVNMAPNEAFAKICGLNLPLLRMTTEIGRAHV